MDTSEPAPTMMTAQQKLMAKIVSVVVFVGALIVGLLLFYYSFLNLRDDGGDWITGTLRWLLENQQSAYALLGTILAALPGLAVPACVRRNGDFSRLGVSIVFLIAATFVVAVSSNLLLVPKFDSPESQEVALLADSAARQLAGFSLTYLGVLLGLKFYERNG